MSVMEMNTWYKWCIPISHDYMKKCGESIFDLWYKSWVKYFYYDYVAMFMIWQSSNQIEIKLSHSCWEEWWCWVWFLMTDYIMVQYMYLSKYIKQVYVMWVLDRVRLTVWRIPQPCRSYLLGWGMWRLNLANVLLLILLKNKKPQT